MDMSDSDDSDVEGGELDSNDKDGAYLSLDEMMHFLGQSSESYCCVPALPPGPHLLAPPTDIHLI
eukprot:2080835-Ditylum_brightwellii.AAC.1